VTTITPNKLWFYKQDLRLVANRLEAIMDTMKASNLHMIEMQDLPPVIGWLEDLETIVNGLVAKKEKETVQ